jgi:ankyrin repeat protein
MKSDKKPRVMSLCKVIRERNVKKAKKLLAEGADVNTKDREGDTPLHLACLYGILDLALLIHEKGASVQVVNKRGATALVYLAMANVPKAPQRLSVCVANALLEGGASVDAGDKEGITPLMWAVNRGNLLLVEFLIGKGADVNASDRVKYNENTVLMYAQRIDVAEVLLRHGADPSICTAGGENAVEYALLNDHIRGYRRLAALIASYLKPDQK